MINLEVTEDMLLVKKLLTTPELWDRISEDGASKEFYFPKCNENHIWVLIKDHEEIIGAIYLHKQTSISIQFHPSLLKEYRNKKYEVINMFYEWFLENINSDINKINVNIPTCFSSIVKFAENVGFKKEGVNYQSYMKYGKYQDLQNLGITRKEIIQFISFKEAA